MAVSAGAPLKPQMTPNILFYFHKSSCANGCSNLRDVKKGNGKGQVSRRWACKPRGQIREPGGCGVSVGRCGLGINDFLCSLWWASRLG